VLGVLVEVLCLDGVSAPSRILRHAGVALIVAAGILRRMASTPVTGMPSFGKAGIPDNELWQIVAFVKKFPSVSESDYKSWSASSQ